MTAFSNSDASIGLMLGSFIAILFTAIYYLISRAMKFKDIMECLPNGFKAMVPAILILIFAWTLKDIFPPLQPGPRRRQPGQSEL